MPTYPLATLAAQVTDAGISAPPFVDILESLKATYRSIYGSDVYLEPDSQDGQLLSAFAAAINDANATAISVYNQFSPATAKGAGLASVVKINGIQKQVASNSTADALIVGQVGSQIDGGQIGDGSGVRWSLPATVIIPAEGEITVTATCAEPGAIPAAANTLTEILTPTLGWQSVTNPAPATEGAPVESDAALRIRQTKSTALGAVTPLKAVEGGLAAIAGVSRLKIYENDTGAPDADGIPGHSIAVVIEGGDADTIGQVIFDKKGFCGSHGSTTVTALDPYGVPKAVKFSRPDVQALEVEIELHPLTGYASTIGDQVKAAVAAYINASAIGADVVTTRLYLPANLYGATDSATFEIVSIQIAKSGDPLGAADIAIAFDELAQIDPADVTLTLV